MQTIIDMQKNRTYIGEVKEDGYIYYTNYKQKRTLVTGEVKEYVNKYRRKRPLKFKKNTKLKTKI